MNIAKCTRRGIRRESRAGRCGLALAFGFLGMSCLPTAWAQTLDKLDYTVRPGDRVLLELGFSDEVAAPRHFTIDDPARIALDFPGVAVNLAEKSQPIGVGKIDGVTALEAAGRARVVINLVRMVPYDIRVEGKTVLISLNEDQGIARARAAEAARVELADVEQGYRITNVDFHRGSKGEGLVQMSFSDAAVDMSIDRSGKELTVSFRGVELPAEWDRRMEVMDFATPVNEIDVFSDADGTQMKIVMRDFAYDYLAYQTDNDLTIEVKPLSEKEQEALKADRFAYVGEKLSLNFQEIEVRAVLQLLADFTGFNLIATDTVAGNVTLRLKNVPWDQAMDIILKSRGLGMRQEGNVIIVAPQEELSARERAQLESAQALEELEALQTEYISINYARATDMAELIRGDAYNLLSDRGSTTVDQRTNTLIVQDISATIAAVKEMVARLDVPVKQVLIETRIVTAQREFIENLGVRFGYSRTKSDSDGRFVQLGGRNRGDVAAGGDETNCPGFCGDGNSPGYITALPIAEATAGRFGLAIGKMGSWLLNLELQASIADNKTEEIASPKVITVNQGEAVVERGVDIPYQEASASGATATAFRKAVLSLRVTPQITPDERVLLDLHVNQDSQSESAQAGDIPIIDTNELSTSVLVEDGETVVLGGVFSDNKVDNTNRIPFFGDLPYVGFLFRDRRQSNTRRELLIFVTPKILGEEI